MNALWLLLAFWIGTMAGFFAFAILAVARDSEDRVSANTATHRRRIAASRTHRGYASAHS